MMKKLSFRTLALVLGISLGGASFGGLSYFAISSSSNAPQLAQAEHIHQGNHYIEKPATTEEDGIREYWICCLCHEAYFDGTCEDVLSGEWVETGTSADHGEGGAREDAIIPRIRYEYAAVAGGVKLTRYLGEYTPLVTVPTSVAGQPVVSIGEGCFVQNEEPELNNRVKKLNEEPEEPEKEYSTFYVDKSIEEIEAGAFEEDNTFLTNSDSKKSDWHDDNMDGDAREEEGNIYFDVQDGESQVANGIVYVYDRTYAGYYLARCLTQRKNVNIPSHIGDVPVTRIGRGAFLRNKHIQKVTIPETIGTIASYAFSHCTNLCDVTFNCPELVSILGSVFAYCTSLEVVVLPPNLGTITCPFRGCGTIKELYISATITKVSAMLINDVTIETIYFAGTEDQWLVAAETLIPHLPEETTVVFGATAQEKVVIDHLSEIEGVGNNTLVSCVGVITGFQGYSNVRYSSLMITDQEDSYTIKCYMNKSLPFDDLDYIGKTVDVTGTRGSYAGEIELTRCTFNVFEDEPKVNVTPTTFPQGNGYDPNDYFYQYCEIRGTIEEMDLESFSIFLKEYPGLYFFANYQEFFEPRVGDIIETKGWVAPYNQRIQFNYDPRCVRLIGEGESIPEPQPIESTIEELLSLEGNSSVAYIVEGTIKTYSSSVGGLNISDDDSNQLYCIQCSAEDEGFMYWDAEIGRYRFRGDKANNSLAIDLYFREGVYIRMKVVSLSVRGHNVYWATILSSEQPTGMYFEQEEYTIPIGSSATIELCFTPHGIPETLELTSSNPEIAVVEGQGIHFGETWVTGITEGTVTITATAPNGLEATCTIIVQPVDIPITE